MVLIIYHRFNKTPLTIINLLDCSFKKKVVGVIDIQIRTVGTHIINLMLLVCTELRLIVYKFNYVGMYLRGTNQFAWR